MKIAYLAPELGTVTSTFVYREIQALQQLGAEISTYSTHRPSDKVVSKEAVSLIQATTYLYDIPAGAAFARALRYALASPGSFTRGAARLLRDALRSNVPSPADRLKLAWHFVMACELAADLRRRGVRHLHAHFAHVPASIAMYAAGLAGIGYSFTAHANDIFERPTALREKVARSAFTVCISEYNRQFLTELGCDPDRQCIVRCALDLAEYAWREPVRNGQPPHLYAVGRFVEKKGFDVLVEALERLRQQGHAFTCTIVGNGPLLDSLRARVSDSSLRECVELPGSLPQERVKELFREADVFVLPCVVAASGDRDGIPVALMEAMAMGVPVVSTTVSGIPELIQSERTGLLVPPSDAAYLADALQRLLTDPQLAKRLTVEARNTMEEVFESKRNAEILWNKINESIRSHSDPNAVFGSAHPHSDSPPVRDRHADARRGEIP